jgi:chromosome segregation ATPase
MFGVFKFRLAWRKVQQRRIDQKEARRRSEEEKSMLQRSLEERKTELKKREEEKSMLQRSLEEHKTELKKREEEKSLLQRSLEEREAELVKRKEAELVKRKEAELSHKREIEALRNAVTLAERKVDEVKGLNSALKNRTNSLEIQNRQLGAQLNQVKVEHQQMVELLDVRTAELKGAQAFLTKADQFSGADIIKLVEDLNGEIMQTAASMAEDLVVVEKKVNGHDEGAESGEIKEGYGRTEEIVGPRMAELLKTTEHHEDPILIQLAFQANMAAYTHWIVSSWCFESPEDEHMLSEIYARVREAGKSPFFEY